MEPAQITFITVVVLGVIWNMVSSHSEKERPKRLMIIEDSDDDYTFIKMFCDFSNTVLERHKSADHLLWKFLLKKPDLVLVDYYLDGEITGDKVIKLCEMFGVKHRLMTGNTQDIEGIPEEKIIRKRSGTEWCGEVQTWFDAATA